MSRWVGAGRQQLALGVALAVTVAGARLTHAAGKGDATDAGRKSGGAGVTAVRAKDARAQAKAIVERAQIDYKLGRFQDALEGYRRAYELYQAPLLLFDMGQCHRNLGDPEKAIFFFEGYLREERRPEAERRRLTEQLIAEARTDLQHKMEAEAAAAAPPPAPPRPVQLRAVDTQRVVASTLVASPSPRDAPEPHRSIASRWWFWTAIGGAALIAAGGAIYYATGQPRLVPPGGSLGTFDAERTTPSQ